MQIEGTPLASQRTPPAFEVEKLVEITNNIIEKFNSYDIEDLGYFKFYRPYISYDENYKDKIEYCEVTYSINYSYQTISKQLLFMINIQDKIRSDYELTKSPIITIGRNKLITIDLLDQMIISLTKLISDRCEYLVKVADQIELIKKLKKKKSLDKHLRILIEMIDYDNYINYQINNVALYMETNGYFHLTEKSLNQK